MFNPIEAITSEIFRHKEVMWLAVVKIILSTGLEMMHHLIISSDCCKYMEEVQMVLSLSSSKDALTHVVSQVCRVNCHQYLPCQCRPSRKRRTTSHRYLSIVGHGFSSQRNIRNQKELYTIIHIHLHTYMIWFDQEFLNHDNCCLRHSSPNRNCGMLWTCWEIRKRSVKMTSWPRVGAMSGKSPNFFLDQKRTQSSANPVICQSKREGVRNGKVMAGVFSNLNKFGIFGAKEKSETSRNASPSSRE